MDYWHKQTTDKPLFTDLLWSRPENRRHAGKLAIIGGNRYGFAVVAAAYNIAVAAGAGSVRVLMPESLRKIVGTVLPECEYATDNPSGSFGQKALAEFLDIGSWSDTTLLAGDLGRNSETAIVLEKFASKYQGGLVVTKDAVDYFTSHPELIVDRASTVLVLSLSQLQKLFKQAKSSVAITFSMDAMRLVEVLHQFTTEHSLEIVVRHAENIFVAVGGQVSTTKISDEKPIWRVETAARCAVWRMQNPDKAFEALTTALVAQ